MAYLNFKIVDGFEVVIGFMPPNLEPVETRKVVDAKIVETDVGKEIAKMGRQIHSIRQTQAALCKKANELDAQGAEMDKNPGPQQVTLAQVIDKRKAINKQYVATAAQLKAMEAIGKKLKPRLRAKIEELRKLHGVKLHTPGIRECEQVTVDSLKSKLATLGPSQYLTTDGVVLTDNRRKTYLYKKGGRWETIRIEELGQVIPDWAKEPDQMTKAEITLFLRQEQVDAIKAMDPDEREKQKQSALNGVMMSAGQMKVGLEMDGDIDAEPKAKAWLKSSKAEIEETYNV